MKHDEKPASPAAAAPLTEKQRRLDRLLDEARVVVESGAFYGPQGEGSLRICFGSQSLPTIKEAVRRLDDFFKRITRI